MSEVTVFTNQWLTLIDRDGYYIVKRRPFVVIVIEQNQNVLMLQQKRPTKETAQFNLPMGFINEDEMPVQAAARELAEETGYKIAESSFVPIGVLTPATAFIESEGHVFYVKITDNKKPHLGQSQDEEESIVSSVWSSFEKAVRLTQDAVSLGALAQWRAWCMDIGH